MQVCLIMYDLLLPPDIKGLITYFVYATKFKSNLIKQSMDVHHAVSTHAQRQKCLLGTFLRKHQNWSNVNGSWWVGYLYLLPLQSYQTYSAQPNHWYPLISLSAIAEISPGFSREISFESSVGYFQKTTDVMFEKQQIYCSIVSW